jgi:hypothetical protein
MCSHGQDMPPELSYAPLVSFVRMVKVQNEGKSVLSIYLNDFCAKNVHLYFEK